MEMKKNKYLRAALLLLICVWVSSVMCSGVTMAKYVANGVGSDTARYAAFSFVVGSQKYKNDGTGDWYSKNSSIGPATSDYWNEIVTGDGINSAIMQSFEVPLFDYEYRPDTPGVASPTIKSKNKELVIAPGCTYASNNPNIPWDPYKHICLRNDSEVTVSYKVEFDPAGLFQAGLGQVYEIYTWSGPTDSLTHRYNGIWRIWAGGGTWTYSAGYPNETLPFPTDDTVHTYMNTITEICPPVVLAPGEDDGFFVGFNWRFNWDQWRDADDTALGLAAATTPSGIWVNPKFIITVTQVD